MSRKKQETCNWFAKCKNISTKQAWHPFMEEWIDICDVHLEWLGENPSPTQFVPPLVGRKLRQLSGKLQS